MSQVTVDGRCSSCLGFVTTAGCQRCWARRVSGGAQGVFLNDDEPTSPWPQLITAFVHEDELPVFNFSASRLPD